MLDCCHAADMDVKDFNAEASAVRSVAVPPGLLMQGEAGVQSAAGGKRFEALARGAPCSARLKHVGRNAEGGSAE
ncbi:MAG: hypothetical protein LC647_09490 [Beggiatoa sp.]|nr:hypothetical protein [Beggiatoa sp.]